MRSIYGCIFFFLIYYQQKVQISKNNRCKCLRVYWFIRKNLPKPNWNDESNITCDGAGFEPEHKSFAIN